MSHPCPLPPADPSPGAAAALSACVPCASRAPVSWPDAARRAAFEAWLAPLVGPHQLLPESLRPASEDASFRRYLRIDSGRGGSCIVMDAPPDQVDCSPFVRVQGLMAAAGLNVPQILAWGERSGFMLLSDLGSRTLIEQLHSDQPQAAWRWYQQATDLLLDWQRASRADLLPAYDAALLRRELAQFPDWYLAGYRSVTLDGAQRTTLASAFDAIVAHNLAAPCVFVHRDFMARNLMAPVQEGAPLGVLDFQDAVHGPITYDIASLLRDAFISWEEEFVIDVTVRYWEKARKAGLLGAGSASGWGADFGEFYCSVEWMGLQRHLKVAGIFARLSLRDGKPRYLADTPRFLAYIRATAGRYRQLAPLRALLEQIEGSAARTDPAHGRV
ncbi:aminoglycoside phosphotransferase family protein [Verminephrobacter aporrectodeae]|uniref:aminoglycoside phosphotransferase family protein n=1 Tax=Verminephrobacter aporrectodeae TaxID=1110389 RepID=UPI0022389E43|nr:phosphotransferase [Verminephrobacter aporrectodeae]